MTFNESAVEEAALYWLRELGYTTVHGEYIAPDTSNAERISYGDVVLVGCRGSCG